MLSGRKTRFAFAVLGILAIANIALASTTGDGENRKKASGLKLSFASTKVSVPFSMKANLRYEKTSLGTFTKTSKFILYSSSMTYRKGNVVYIMPVKQKTILPQFIKCSPDKK